VSKAIPLFYHRLIHKMMILRHHNCQNCFYAMSTQLPDQRWSAPPPPTSDGEHYGFLGQGYRTPRVMVINGYGAIVRWWLTGENRGIRRETCSTGISFVKNFTWIHPALNPGLHSEKAASDRGSNVCLSIVICDCVLQVISSSRI
jgi:hypothetical protein